MSNPGGRRGPRIARRRKVLKTTWILTTRSTSKFSRPELLEPVRVRQGQGHQVLAEEQAEAALQAGGLAEGRHQVGAAGGGGPEEGGHGVEAVRLHPRGGGVVAGDDQD